jgi:hypothetical protein
MVELTRTSRDALRARGAAKVAFPQLWNHWRFTTAASSTLVNSHAMLVVTAHELVVVMVMYGACLADTGRGRPAAKCCVGIADMRILCHYDADQYERSKHCGVEVHGDELK